MAREAWMPEEKSAILAAVRHWRDLAELACFAVQRRGFGDTDGGFGVTYPEDLDEYDREAEVRAIPPGFVGVYGFWGPPDGYEVVVSESRYLSVLAEVLDAEGRSTDADRVRSLIA
jgi:hypothetical protein